MTQGQERHRLDPTVERAAGLIIKLTCNTLTQQAANLV